MNAAPGTRRLFVAVPVPDEVRERLAGAQAGLDCAVPAARIRWTVPAQLHLTVQFLGAAAAAEVPRLGDALARAVAGFGPLHLAAQSVGFFPHPRHPRVVWAGVEGEKERCRALHKLVAAACAPFAPAAADEPFQAHITLGRPRDLDRAAVDALFTAAVGFSGVSFGEWTAAAVELRASELTPGGARHDTVTVAPLV